MSRHGLLGLLVLAVILTLAPGASAGMGTTWEYAVPLAYPGLDDAYWARPAARQTPDLEAALATAQAHWGPPPPCGRPVVRYIRDWPTAGVAWPDRCLIDINPTLSGRDFDSLCELVTHEVGHLPLSATAIPATLCTTPPSRAPSWTIGPMTRRAWCPRATVSDDAGHFSSAGCFT